MNLLQIRIAATVSPSLRSTSQGQCPHLSRSHRRGCHFVWIRRPRWRDRCLDQHGSQHRYRHRPRNLGCNQRRRRRPLPHHPHLSRERLQRQQEHRWMNHRPCYHRGSGRLQRELRPRWRRLQKGRPPHCLQQPRRLPSPFRRNESWEGPSRETRRRRGLGDPQSSRRLPGCR